MVACYVFQFMWQMKSYASNKMTLKISKPNTYLLVSIFNYYVDRDWDITH